MDHSGRRGAYRVTVDVEPIDLGDEPPLFVDGARNELVDRRRVSVQWFSGTILTGLCGTALMGGAVFAALDGETNFATVPERVELALRGTLGGAADRGTRKADRLPPVVELNSLRRVIPATQTSRGANNREIMRVRQFVRVAGNLSLSVSELSANIPPFNPQKTMLGDAATGGAEADGAPDVDAEVSFTTRDLASVLPRAKIAAVQSADEVIERVREAANWSTGAAPARTAADLRGNVKLAYAAEGGPDPYAGFAARMIPENITLLPKTAPHATGGNDYSEKTITLKKGDSVSTVLRDLGATPEEIKAIAAVLGTRGKDGGVKEGQKLRVLLAPTRGADRLQPIRIIVADDTSVQAVAALSDLGKYVAVDPRSMDTAVAQTREPEEEDDGKGVRLYQSIYETALRNQVPRALIDDLIRIYSYDIDFQRKVQPGDSFEVFFAGEDESSSAKPEVLFASLTTAGETRKFYRFQSTDDGLVDYYDETGKSAKKFLVRKPVAEGLMTSGFGARNHPLLEYMRMHTGVDWAAGTGTPIYAAGNGTIEKIGWEGGYGKYIRIRHANGYETGYGHMSVFARNLVEGKKVRQGQLIGYVGSTGLSTGAHLHYEILINGRFVDPMKIKLPRGRVLEGAMLASFEQERDRLDGMMSRSAPSAHSPAKLASTAANH